MTDTEWEVRGRRWWSHVGALAGNSTEGRETGSSGYQRAAEYVIEQFRAAGLDPAGSDGFRQWLDLRVSLLDEAGTSLALAFPGGTEPLPLRDAVQVVATGGTAPETEADLVFVGYGLEVPEHRYSDFEGIDLHGKIAVYFRGGPPELPGAVKAHYQSPDERLRALRRAGAVGSMMILNPKVPDLPWPRLASGLALPRMELAERGPDDRRPLSLSTYFNPERLDLLLRGSGHSAAEIVDRLGGPGPLPRFPLSGRLRARVAVRRSTVRCSNVVGVLRGGDPERRDEYVVGSAHLDHLGVGETDGGRRIYPGAMDNASGVATLIEIARAFRESGRPPRRSILFVAVTGEEKGLLGSEYFAQHPTVPGPIVADLNMDMFLPLYPMRYLEVQGLGESSLGPALRSMAAEVGVEAQPEYEPDRVLFIRSDQYNFVKIGAPSLMLSIGYEKGSREEAISQAWFRERYHAPADDLDQPVDREAAARFTDLLGRFVRRVADEPARPTWNAESFFRRFAR